VPKNYAEIDEPEKQDKIMKFLEILEDHDDVQRVFSNF
jgi:transcriptional/translational regulatory protein YebC/TACO1